MDFPPCFSPVNMLISLSQKKVAIEQWDRLEGNGEKNTDFEEKPSCNSFFFFALQSPVCLLCLLLSWCDTRVLMVRQLQYLWDPELMTS